MASEGRSGIRRPRGVAEGGVCGTGKRVAGVIRGVGDVDG